MSQYSTKILTCRDDVSAFTAKWKQWWLHQSERYIDNHPDWAITSDDNSQHRNHRLLVAVLNDDKQAVCIAPFQVYNWSWECKLGYWTILKLPMISANLGGDTLVVPAEAHEKLWQAIADCDVRYNLIKLECLPQDSNLWRTIHESSTIHKRFWIYKPNGISPRHRIHLTGSFDGYLAKFDKERRRKLKQELNRLEKACAGDFFFERITSADQVPDFMRAVETLSLASWQGKKLGQAICNTPEAVQRLQACAAQGWLRCYLIRTSKMPIAFGIGFQCDQVYRFEHTGFDPSWKARSPGKVMLMRMIEDLCLYQPKEWFDFRLGDMQYKQFFGTHTFPEATVFLIRKSAYNWLALATQLTFITFGKTVRKALRWSGLSKLMRNLLRGE